MLKSARIAIIEGIINRPLPKKKRHSAEQPRPISAVQCDFSLSHCSIKITTNIAVITKSRPFVLNVIREPKIPPSVAPETQYR